MLVACEKNSIDSKAIQNFCTNLKVGSDVDAVRDSLDKIDLEIRTRAPEAPNEVAKLLRDPYTVDGAMITAKSLPFDKAAPACVIYFSSQAYGGDDKVIHKAFTAKTLPGI
jgi:hypothetical protein